MMTKQRKILFLAGAVALAVALYFLVRLTNKKSSSPEYHHERGGQAFTEKLGPDHNRMYYIEEDESFRHIWQVACVLSGKGHVCRVKGITLMPTLCMINGWSWFDWVPAKRTNSGGYIVEPIPVGGCGYKHTYVFDENQMTDTRVPTAETPMEAGFPGACSTTPTVRKAKRHELVVLKNPLVDCDTLQVIPD